MLLSQNTMRLLLLVCLLGLQVLGALYLRRRRLTLMAYLGWGLLATLVPALGPFLVILCAPGQPWVRYGRSMRRGTPHWLQRFRERGSC